MCKGAKGCEMERVEKLPGATSGYTCEEVCWDIQQDSCISWREMKPHASYACFESAICIDKMDDTVYVLDTELVGILNNQVNHFLFDVNAYAVGVQFHTMTRNA